MLIEDGGDKVEQPGDGASADNPDNTDNEGEGILGCNALDDTVDSPNDVEHRDAKDDLGDPRQVIHKLDEFFHNFSPFLF